MFTSVQPLHFIERSIKFWYTTKYRLIYKMCVCIYSDGWVTSSLTRLTQPRRQKRWIFDDSVFNNTMRTIVHPVLYIIIYVYSIWAQCMYTIDNPLQGIKSHPIWKKYVEKRHTKYIELRDSQLLPGNKWSDYLLMNFTQLKVTITIMNMLSQYSVCKVTHMGDQYNRTN